MESGADRNDKTCTISLVRYMHDFVPTNHYLYDLGITPYYGIHYHKPWCRKYMYSDKTD